MLKIKLTSNLSPGPPLELPVSECCSQHSLRERKHHPALPHSHLGGGQRPPRLSLFVCPALARAVLPAKGGISQHGASLEGNREERRPQSPVPAILPFPPAPEAQRGRLAYPSSPRVGGKATCFVLSTPCFQSQSTACGTSGSGSVLSELPGQQWEGPMQPSAFPLRSPS